MTHMHKSQSFTSKNISPMNAFHCILYYMKLVSFFIQANLVFGQIYQ